MSALFGCVLFQQVINNITQEHSDRCVIILPHVNLISELSAMDTIWYSNTLRLHRTWVAHCASFGADGLLLADIPGSGYLNNFVIYIFFIPGHMSASGILPSHW